jgi:glycosyltransferase involved in cell wall biosynthesis
MLPELATVWSIRLVMTTDAVGGVWQYALDLAQGLRAYEITTTLCNLGPAPGPDQQAAARRIPGLELLCLDLPLDWTARTPGLVLEAGASVAAAARLRGSEIVHLNSPALAAGYPFPAPVVAVCHSCVATWWQAVRSGPLPREFAWRKELVRRGLQKADARVAPTTAFSGCLKRTYDLQSSPAVIHNGRRPRLREAATGRPDSGPGTFAFTAGRLWDEGKNVRAIDRAAARLSLPVFAAGPLEGPNGACIRLRHLKLLGQLSDGQVTDWLAATPIFVSTARYEPFGLAVLEAAEAGCPLVLSDIPSFRELWGGAAEFVDPGSVSSIAGALDRVSGDASLRAQLGAAARRRSRRYTPEVMAAKVHRLYGSLLSRNAAVRSRRGVAA